MENRLAKRMEHEMETGFLDLPHQIRTTLLKIRIVRIISNKNNSKISSSNIDRNNNSNDIYIYIYTSNDKNSKSNLYTMNSG